jgi:hypothetical protein
MTYTSALTSACGQKKVGTYILDGLIMYLQSPLVLIQYTIKDLIEDHLTQFLLDNLDILSDFLCDPGKLN